MQRAINEPMSQDKESLERHEDSLEKIGPQICCIPNGS